MLKLTKLFLPVAIIILLASACSHNSDQTTTTSTASTSSTTSTSDRSNSSNISQVSLRTVSSCDALLTHFKTEALKIVGPYGFTNRNSIGIGIARLESDAVTSSPPALNASQESAKTTPTFSLTNVQVQGVDEADIVKTDGTRIIGISSGEFWIADATVNPAKKVSSLIIGTDYDSIEFILYKDKALAFVNTRKPLTFFGSSDESSAFANTINSSTITQIIEIDISNNQAEILNNIVVEGENIGARRVGNTVNIVISTSKASNLGFVYPSDSSQRAKDRAEKVNRQAITDSTINDWLPNSYTVDENTGDNNDDSASSFSVCSQVYIPSKYSGLDVLSIATIDLDQSLTTIGKSSILASGNTIYSTGKTLYVAHNIYNPPVAIVDEDGTPANRSEQDVVFFHKFSTPAGANATYLASGSATGKLLSQFSMHETPNGDFWIVTTVTTNTESSNTNTFTTFSSTTESFVSSFRQTNSNLIMLGKVGNLGKNERVQSVRFIKEKAYVVTFRQIDPFYVVDLSDSENPIVTGELKIPGFSSYLHPLGNDQLLGVGSSADEQGRVTGGKLSLFDASDPANPLEIAVLELGSGFTDVSWDYKAFLYWSPAKRVVLPFRSYRTNFFGAIVIHLDPKDSNSKLNEVGRFIHDTANRNDICDVIRLPATVRPSIDNDNDNEETSVDSEGPSSSTTTQSEKRRCNFTNNESIQRTLIIDNTLWSLSNNFLEARDVATLIKLDSLKVTDSIIVQ